MRNLKILGCALVLAMAFGCARTSDIDLSRLERGCANGCATTYSACLSRFTMFPIQAQNQCTDALRLCAQTCPVRQGTSP